MKNKVLDFDQDDELKTPRNENNEVLEISSTGYGLESVSIENVEEKSKQGQNTNFSCGGL
jgi:hypothetical protein